jgi:hypothetical protein
MFPLLETEFSESGGEKKESTLWLQKAVEYTSPLLTKINLCERIRSKAGVSRFLPGRADKSRVSFTPHFFASR